MISHCVILWLPLSLSIAQIVCAQESRRRIGDPLPSAQGAVDLHVTPNPRDLPSSMRDLVDRSVLVVDGTVTKVYPARETSPRALETDALITVTDVLKGSKSINRIVISQGGGFKDGLVINPVQYSLAEVGVRCLWFRKISDSMRLPAMESIGTS